MSITNLNSVQKGRVARIVSYDNNIKNEKTLKYIAHLGIFRGKFIEVIDNKMSDLMILRVNDSTFGISKKIADHILVKII